MIPQEEYYQRHRLAVPEVHYTLTTGSLLLRVDTTASDLPSKWLMVLLSWNESGNHPGHYTTRFLVPAHDGGNSREIFRGVLGYPPFLRIDYEQVEGFFTDFAKSHGAIRALANPLEVALTGWEIFLYCFDSYIAKHAGQGLQEAIEASLNLDQTPEERFAAYTEATNLLIVEQSWVFERYESLIHSHTKRSLRWLARLVNGA